MPSFVIVYEPQSPQSRPSYYREGMGWWGRLTLATKYATRDEADEALSKIQKPGPTTFGRWL